MTINYHDLRDKLSDLLGNTPGVLTVGITKSSDNYALAVIVDSNITKEVESQIPKDFGGLEVIIKHFGDAKT